jgi:hypothetical protein
VDPADKRVRFERPSTLQQFRECLRQFREWLTEDEGQQLLKELVTDLERKPA